MKLLRVLDAAVIVALIGFFGVIVTNWTNAKLIYESLVSQEECFYNSTKIGEDMFYHMFCFDRSVECRDARHIDFNGGYPNYKVILSTSCNDNEIRFVGTRPDGHRGGGTYKFHDGEISFEPTNHPNAITKVSRVPAPSIAN